MTTCRRKKSKPISHHPTGTPPAATPPYDPWVEQAARLRRERDEMLAQYLPLQQHRTVLLVGYDLKRAAQEAGKIFRYAWNCNGYTTLNDFTRICDYVHVRTPPQLYISNLSAFPDELQPALENLLRRPDARIVALVPERGGQYDCLFDSIIENPRSAQNLLETIERAFQNYIANEPKLTACVTSLFEDDQDLRGLESGVYNYLERHFALDFTDVTSDRFKKIATNQSLPLPVKDNPGFHKQKLYSSVTCVKWWVCVKHSPLSRMHRR
jgi:hypothetical protein